MKLTAVFEPDEEGGYIAYIEEIPGVNTQGETLEEAKTNILDALNLVMETRRAMAERDIKKSRTQKRKYIREDIVFA
ncbi:MAG: type II toxin-antitoxin system HicB family antitoxin [Bacteroidia bacterium]|nr:type II toxin-antitoxin system HicB family antitoxin [Bacteroidia bacterium]